MEQAKQYILLLNESIVDFLPTISSSSSSSSSFNVHSNVRLYERPPLHTCTGWTVFPTHLSFATNDFKDEMEAFWQAVKSEA